MVKHYCDRCGREISSIVSTPSFLPAFLKVKASIGVVNEWVDCDLCSDCRDALLDWLAGSKEAVGEKEEEKILKDFKRCASHSCTFCPYETCTELWAKVSDYLNKKQD